MKKILLFLLLAAVACTKPATQLVSVRFDYTTESGQFPTKSIADEIMATLPASLDLVLTDAYGKTWNVTTRQEITIPVGTYSITGGYSPDAVQTIASGKYTTLSPIIEVNDSVAIVEGFNPFSRQIAMKLSQKMSVICMGRSVTWYSSSIPLRCFLRLEVALA